MELQLRPAELRDCRRLRPLYISSFPAEERAPFFRMMRRSLEGRGRMLVAEDGGRFVGFVYLISSRDIGYIFYLAIDATERGKGYGSGVLKKLIAEYSGKRLFLALEGPDPAAENLQERRKRHEFYIKNGFEDLPVRIKEGNVIFDAMGVGGSVSAPEYDRLMTMWAGKLVRRFVDFKLIEQ